MTKLLATPVLALGLWFSSQATQAQQQPAFPAWASETVHEKVAEVSMEDAADRLLGPPGVGFIIEGVPHLKSAQVELNGTREVCLNRLSETFDYTWSLSRSGIVLFTKRFKSAADYPQISMTELRKVAGDAVAILRTFSGNFGSDWSQQLDQLARSLTPVQKATLNQGGKLTVRELSGDQVRLLERTVIANTFAMSSRAWSAFRSQLDGMEKSYLLLEENRVYKRGDGVAIPYLLVHAEDISGVAKRTIIHPPLGLKSGFQR